MMGADVRFAMRAELSGFALLYCVRLVGAERLCTAAVTLFTMAIRFVNLLILLVAYNKVHEL